MYVYQYISTDQYPKKQAKSKHFMCYLVNIVDSFTLKSLPTAL